MQYYNSQMYNGGVPMQPYNSNIPFNQSQNPYGMNQQAPQMIQNKPQVDPRQFETPQIVYQGQSLFKAVDDKKKDYNVLKMDNVPDMEAEAKKRKPRSSNKSSGSTEIIKAKGINPEKLSGTVENTATIYSYGETTNLLHETLGQIDAINGELVQEFDSVRHNRTMKNKYNVLIGLSENIGSMINNRLSAIKEINNCISKSNDMDYKKLKDIKAAEANVNDDKYISDIYQAFIQNPQNMAPQYQMSPIQNIDPAIVGSGIIRTNINQSDLSPTGGNMDLGYLQYMANLTPEQNMMRYEGDPNVKQVVVYDASSGAKFFQVMNLATGEVIPNVPVYDQMFMEDTTLDLKKGVATNINLNESFPIVTINNEVTSQY